MKTQCPNCKSRFNVVEAAVGKQANCPKCSKPFIIEPVAETPAPSPQAAAPVAESPVAKAPAVQIPQPVKIPVKTEAPAPPPPVKYEKPQPKAVSKTVLPKIVFVYGWAIVRIITGAVGALGLMMAIQKGEYSTVIKTFIVADIFLILGVSIELALYYKMWAVIRDGDVTASPTNAVLFLFIPFFNLYWMLNMLIGFAEDYNAFIQERSIKVKELPVMLFLIYAFLSILTAIVVTVPMLCVFGIAHRIYGAFASYTQAAWAVFFFVSVVAAAHFITYIFVSIKTCNTMNDLTSELAKSK